jgi:hypothetical protein
MIALAPDEAGAEKVRAVLAATDPGAFVTGVGSG